MRFKKFNSRIVISHFRSMRVATFTCSVTRSDLLPEKHWEQVKKEVKTWRQNIKTVMWQ